MLRLYEQHDVLVMPSRNEGLPVALLEAGAAALIPVVSDLPSGIPEVVESGVSGYRVPVGDIRRFADAIFPSAVMAVLMKTKGKLSFLPGMRSSLDY